MGSAQVEYPSGVVRYVSILPTGTTPFINHAPSAHHLRPGHQRPYIANVSMGYGKVLKINNQWRPVIPLRATVDIEPGEELFFDYGKTLQSIYFESLGRRKLPPSPLLFDELSSLVENIINAEFLAWANRNNKMPNEISEEEFLLELYINFLNSPPDYLVPDESFVPN